MVHLSPHIFASRKSGRAPVGLSDRAPSSCCCALATEPQSLPTTDASIDQEAVVRGHLLNNLARYQPLFDGSDPDGILPLVRVWQALTATEKAAIGPYLPYGMFADWVGLLTVEGLHDPQQQIADLLFKRTWADVLSTEQRTVLLKFLAHGGVADSNYGRPLFNGDPDGVISALAQMAMV